MDALMTQLMAFVMELEMEALMTQLMAFVTRLEMEALMASLMTFVTGLRMDALMLMALLKALELATELSVLRLHTASSHQCNQRIACQMRHSRFLCGSCLLELELHRFPN